MRSQRDYTINKKESEAKNTVAIKEFHHKT